MTFIHEDPEFRELVAIVADEAGIAPALIEKDYWVTHVLWALHNAGLEVWFKGGTSLSKGFGLIQRFSEDLDLRIESGTAEDVPPVKSWTSTNKKPVAERSRFFESLASAINVPHASVELEAMELDKYARSANYRVHYPGSFLMDLNPVMRPFVLLEVGVARVTPFVQRRLRSFVHDFLDRRGQLSLFDDNRPKEVRCVHPLVTLLEKLDAIMRRHPREPMEPASFVRHYEDAAQIVANLNELPPLGVDVWALADEMEAEGQISRRPTAGDPAFLLSDESRRRALTEAHGAIAAMYWGPRFSLDHACEIIRAWLSSQPSPKFQR